MKTNSVENIRLRSFEESDADTLYKWENDMQDWHTNEIYNPISKAYIKDFILNSCHYLKDNSDITLAVETNETNLIGYVQILEYNAINRRAFIGIFIDKEYRNKGFGHKALNSIIKYAFSRWNIRILFAKILSNNEESKKLFEKCGFIQTASIPQWAWINNDFVALNFYTLCNQ